MSPAMVNRSPSPLESVIVKVVTGVPVLAEVIASRPPAAPKVIPPVV